MNEDTYKRTSLLIMLAGIAAVLAGPLFLANSMAWAQLDASQQQSAFRLVGTIEGGPFTGAVIDDTKNPQAFYRLNDRLPDNSQIVKVANNHIVLKSPDGASMELYTTPGTGGGSAAAAPVAAMPAAPLRPMGQPTPERSVDLKRRAARVRTDPSAGPNGVAASGRPPRVDNQNPNQQNPQAQDPNKSKGGGRRNRPRPAEGN